MRSDFLERRLEGCEHLTTVKGFLKPQQEVKSSGVNTDNDVGFFQLDSLLSSAVGGIVANNVAALDGLEKQLYNRINFPWLSSSPAPPKRIAWVAGRADLSLGRRIFEAAWALGITLVIIDKPGHWIQQDDPRWSHLREAFIPLDISSDAGFVDRLVSAIRNYGKPVHGIATVKVPLIVGVAKACEILGFPTSPSRAYEIAGDKYRTRELEPTENEAFCVSSTTHLNNRLDTGDHPLLQYPLIVKPCDGWSSECVSKVHDQVELVQAVEKALDPQRTGQEKSADVMIEPYIEGPEVDANLVLLDGEVIFCEVSDDFPKSGDRQGTDWKANFQETSMLLPTSLPQTEVDIIRNSLHQTVLRQGFKNGILHCEGRMRYSSMSYTVKNGIEDLYANEQSNCQPPSFFLHEVNARSPGYAWSVATAMTYGVDYYALQLLYAVGDLERVRIFVQPFMDGPQWWLMLLAIGADKEGILKTEDPAKELIERVKELRPAVPDYKCFYPKGSRLSGAHASKLGFLALFSIISKKSREQAIRLANKARAEFHYEVE